MLSLCYNPFASSTQGSGRTYQRRQERTTTMMEVCSEQLLGAVLVRQDVLHRFESAMRETCLDANNLLEHFFILHHRQHSLRHSSNGRSCYFHPQMCSSERSQQNMTDDSSHPLPKSTYLPSSNQKSSSRYTRSSQPIGDNSIHKSMAVDDESVSLHKSHIVTDCSSPTLPPFDSDGCETNQDGGSRQLVPDDVKMETPPLLGEIKIEVQSPVVEPSSGDGESNSFWERQSRELNFDGAMHDPSDTLAACKNDFDQTGFEVVEFIPPKRSETANCSVLRLSGAPEISKTQTLHFKTDIYNKPCRSSGSDILEQSNKRLLDAAENFNSSVEGDRRNPTLPVSFQPVKTDMEERMLGVLANIQKQLVSLTAGHETNCKKSNSASSFGETLCGGAQTASFNNEIKLPLHSMEDLEAMEERLNDPHIQEWLINNLCRIGGSNKEDLVRRILKSTITTELAMQFNWVGKGEKRAFSPLRLMDIITRACLQSPTHMLTKMDVEEVTKLWLRYAFDRSGGRKRRRIISQMRQQKGNS